MPTSYPQATRSSAMLLGHHLMAGGVVCLLFLAAAIGSAASVSAGEIYRYRDARGQLAYSDQRPNGPAERITAPPAPRQSEQDRARRDAQLANLDQIYAEHVQREQARAAAEDAAKAERARQCAAARAENARFDYGGRLYRIDEQGNRVYYSSEEIDRRRAEAARQMQQFCPRAPVVR